MNKEWFTRSYQEHVDATYLRNMIIATKFFIGWFKESNMPYKQMLSKMHEVISDGYQGYTNSNYMVKISDGFRGDAKTIWYPTLKKYWFKDISNEPIIRPKVVSMSEEISHWLENTMEGYVLHLPDSKYVYLYLGKMNALMNNMKRESKLNLRMLANYIDLFVIGHPFEKINFSICMAQVNAILYLNGYKAIYHGYLDFECFMYDYDRVEETFIGNIRFANETSTN